MASGIYIIINTKNQKLYIGSAANIQRRFARHKEGLSHGNHFNKHLQRAWNKYGEKAFQFAVLEHCPKADILTREQHWLDVYMPRGMCYNINSQARGGGRPASEETRRKISAANKGKPKSAEHRHKIAQAITGKPKSLEARRKQSISRTGRTIGDETRRKMSTRHKKQYICISPEGEKHYVVGLTAFCALNNLNQPSMSDVALGNKRHYRGWVCRYATGVENE